MGTWLYVLMGTLLIPLCMIIVGGIFWKKPPQNRNAVYGYRTKRSMASQEAWDFAHRYAGRLWLLLGVVTLVVTILAMLNSRGQEKEALHFFGITVVLAQLLPFIGTIPATEQALRREFELKQKK